MNKTIQILSEICEKNRFAEKLLFVPSYSIGHQIGEHLAKIGRSWINLRKTTVAGYAQELVAPDLGKEGIRLIETHENFLIIEEILRGDESLGGIGCYFEGSPDIHGLIRCLGNTINELRMAGVRATDIDPGSFIVTQKAEEIQGILDSYEAFLSANRLIDRVGLIATAIRKIQNGVKPSGKRVIMVLSDFPLAELEKQFIGFLGGFELKVIRHSKPAALEPPKRFFNVPDKEKDESFESKSDSDLLHWLYKPEKAPPPINDGSVSLFHALGESNEVREVFRRILSQDLPIDDVEILVTKTDPYVSLIYEIANSLDIPVTFSGGIPITYTRPGRALIFYLKWQAEDFISGYVKRLFSGGYLDLDTIDLEGEKPSPGKAATIVREAGIGWGRERYSDRLKALEESYLARAEERRENGEEEKAERAKKEAAQTAWVSHFIEKILAPIIHENPAETVTLENVCKGAVEFLKRFCRIAGEMDAGARSRLVEILNSLAQSPSSSDTAKNMLERVIGIAKETSIGHSNPKPGHINVSHYRSGGYSGRSNTFVLGLDQAKFPGPLLQDPVILDREREKLSSTLSLAKDLLEENLYSMSKMLCSLKGKVSLSFSCRDLREDRDLFPSSILLSAYRLITGDREGDYSDLKRFLGQPAGFVPFNTPLNDTEWWLNKRDLNYGSDSVLDSYVHLHEGEQAKIERENETLTEYEGWLPSSRGALDPLNRDAVQSCSRLEDLAKCPFAFFIRHVLGIEPLEDMEKDPGRWLDPLQRGELLHDVFCRFMEKLKTNGELPELSKHLERLETIAMEEVERWKEEVPPSSELAFNREIKDIGRTLEIFLRDEEERCKRVAPSFFELSFGTSWEKRCGTMVEQPVEIVLNKGRSFKLRGRIDRVDQSGEHEYEVWDYKTGSSYAYKEEGYLNQGKHLQHALYAVAAEILLRRKQDKKAKVVRSGYFFPSPKGEGLRIEKAQLNRNELYEVLEDLFELFRTGVFPATYDKAICRFCDYVKICGGAEVAVPRTVAKMGNDDKMTPFGRLKDHA